jgi:hypothetical protein
MVEGYCTTSRGDFSQFHMLYPRGPGISMSAEAGQRVHFHINSDVPYKVELMRLRSAADVFAPDKSLRATLITPDGQLDYTGSPVSLPAHPQSRPADSWSNGCAWEPHFSLDFSTEWQSGFYSAYCLGNDSSEFYISFIVKPSYSAFSLLLDQPRRSRFAMLASTNTWNAYNLYGGRSYYMLEGDRQLNYLQGKLSFERPFPLLRPCAPNPPNDAIDFNSRHTLRADLWLHTWLEDNGYDIDLFTDLDFHFGLFDPADYAGLILGTHPEYWTLEMRDRLDHYLQHGGRLLYLGGNGLYERVVVDPQYISKLEFRPTGHADSDRWFFRKQGRSERAVLGVAYSAWGKSLSGYRARAPKHRFFDGTDVSDGTSFGDSGLTGTNGHSANGRACGWETDTTNLDDGISSAGPAPEGVVVLAESDPPYCQMTAWDTPWGGLVYSVGSLCYTGSLGQDPVLAPILRNVLDECLGPSPLPWDPKILKWLEEALRVPPRKPEPPGPVEAPENEIMLGLLVTRLASHSRSETTVKELKRVGFTIVAEAAQKALRS